MIQEPSKLNNILWLGGSPCSGKSSIANRLAQAFDLRVYHCDDHFDQHVQRADPASQPRLHWVAQASWDEIFMRPVEVMIEDEREIYRQEFPMILSDLIELSRDCDGETSDKVALIIEGTALLPELVAPLLPSRRHGLWLIPSPEFQRRVYPQRGPWVQEILARCSHPERAFQNWMDRDIGYGQRVSQTASEIDLPAIVVDGSQSLDAIADRVRAHFAPCLER